MSLVTHMISDFARNLVSGLRLVLLFPTRMADFRPSLTASLLLLAVSVAVIGMLDFARQQGEVYFNDYGAGLLGTALLLIFLFVLIVARTQASLERAPDFLTVLFSGLPWVALGIAAMRLFVDASEHYETHWLVFLVWCVTIVVRATQIVFPQGSSTVFVVTGFVAALLPIAAWHRGIQADLFFSVDSREWEQYAAVDQEAVFYHQAALMDRKLGEITPGQPDATELYFIGFAGNGNESVFSTEARYARDLMDRRFATSGRSLVLSSRAQELMEEPLANTHNLFRAISHVGKNMDKGQDILFIFLTSHGSRDATLDVSLFPFQLKQLSANDLRDALDDAGIEWRIIVVSACFSGSFIEPLKNERTILITASSAERNSFGCSKDRELTYFGEAFFKSALANETKLLNSFELAKKIVREMEQDDGLKSSDPQIYIGPEMKRKLEETALGGL